MILKVFTRKFNGLPDAVPPKKKKKNEHGK